MASKLDFVFELIDKASAPANAIAKSFKNVGEVSATVAAPTAKAFKAVGGAASAAASPLKALSGIAGQIAIGALRKIGEVGIDAAGEFLHAIPEMLAFKEQSLNALKLFTGSAEEAAKLQVKILDFAKDFGVKPEAALEGVQTMLAAGLGLDKAMEIFKAALDLRALTGKDVTQITRLFDKIKAQGKIGQDVLSDFTVAAGLSAEQIQEALGKIRGVNVHTPEGLAKLKKDISEGAIGSEQGIEGILDAIRGVTKSTELGSFAKASTQSLGGLFETLKNAPAQFILRAETSGAIGPLKTLLAAVGEALDPRTTRGQAIVSAIAAIATAIGAAIPVISEMAQAFGAGAFASFATITKPIADVFRNTTSTGLNFVDMARNLGVVIGAVATVLVVGFGAIAAVVAFAADNWRIFAGVLAFLFAPLVALAAGFVLIIDAVLAFVATFVSAVSASSSLGSGIVNGIWLGMQAAWGTLKAGWNSLISSLPASVAAKLQISSPSKVFEDLGMNVVQGFNLGIQGQAANTNSALGGAVAAPAVTAASFGGGRNGGGAGGGVNITVQVQAAKGMSEEDAAAQGRAIGRGLREELADVLDDLAASQGLLVGAA